MQTRLAAAAIPATISGNIMQFSFSGLDGGRLFAVFLASVLLITSASCGKVEDDGQPFTGIPRGLETAEVRVSATGVDASEPAIAASGDGSMYALYVEHLPDKSADLYVTKYGADLTQAGERVRVNPIGGEVKTWYGDPPTIAVGRDGTVFVGWTRRAPGAKAIGTDVMLSVSCDGAKTFAEPVKVNDDVRPAAHGMHSMAVTAGVVYISWLDERNVKPAAHSEMHVEPNSEVFFASSNDGGRTFSKNIRVASDVCPCCKTATLAANGKLYLSWRQVLPGEFRHIAVASSNDGGQTFSNASIVSDDKWMLTACPMSGPALMATEAGELVAAWYTAGSAGDPGLYRAVSKDGGRTFEPRSLVSSDAVGGTPVLLSGREGFRTVFAVNDQKVVVNYADGNAAAKDISNALLPTAAMSGETVTALFVRREGDRRSIWLAR